jgi:predicted nucleic acid-binding protein
LKYLLDTCVISELIKPQKNEKVISWIREIDENYLFISVLTIGEIRKGISKLPESKKKKVLIDWLENDLKKRFNGRILGITEDIAILWGELSGIQEQKGLKIPVIDCLLAATAINANLSFVTRNTKDIENTGCNIVNPWE